MLTLNLGCGWQKYGDVRLDKYMSSANIIADIEICLPFRDCSFDVVYSQFVFEHLKNPSFTLKEVVRVCKPNGRVIIITDNASCISHHLKNGAHSGGYGRISMGPEDKHYELYTLEHIRNHFEAVNLLVKKLDLIPGKTGPLQALCRLSSFLRDLPFIEIFRTFTCAHILAVGEKCAKSSTN